MDTASMPKTQALVTFAGTDQRILASVAAASLGNFRIAEDESIWRDGSPPTSSACVLLVTHVFLFFYSFYSF